MRRSRAASDPVSPPDAPSVAGVIKIGPTHADGLLSLVGLNSNVRQGDPLSAMHLDAEVSCGVAPLRVGGHDYNLALRTCHLSLARENCEVEIGSRYEFWLNDGKFEASAVQRQTLDRSHERGLNIGAEGDSNKGLARFFGGLKWSRSRAQGDKIEAITQQNARIELIAAAGQDRWTIGDALRGDARREDRLLGGVYFNEGADNDEVKPLCILSCTDQRARLSVTLTASVSFGSLIISRGGKWATEEDQKGARKILKKKASTALKEHDKREATALKDHNAELRARVAGLVLAKSIREAQSRMGLEVPDNEFVIAQQTLIVLSTLAGPEE